MSDAVFVKPGMSPREIVQAVRALPGVALTSVGMRDAGQSDFKNRHRITDLIKQAPYYDRMGLFSSECHGGARWHVGVMNRRESPFEEIAQFREQMPNVLLQTLIRENNLFGYRPYPKSIVEHVVSRVDIDVWRCFSFLNDVDNMRTVAETVMKRNKLFEPAISFTQADWTTNEYYLDVARRIVDLAGGTREIILAIKDMAGVGSPERTRSLVDAILQEFPDLVIHYHRHITDGLAMPAILAAARAGAKIIDVEEDTLVRFYAHSPILGVEAFLMEAGIPVHLDREQAELAVQEAREWVGNYGWAESPFKGYDHTVTQHRMPGGAFPSSFEQAEKGGFLHLMPSILKVMSYYNQIIKYFDVTPGSQITWVTCSGIVNRYDKEEGRAGVDHLIALLKKFVKDQNQDLMLMSETERQELLTLFRNAPGDFKNLLVGGYGNLPVGWPADWVYRSAFGPEWEQKIAERDQERPEQKDEDLYALRSKMLDLIGRRPTEEEFILYLMHPKDALEYLDFVEEYGDAPLVLPTEVWREGLHKPGQTVEFELWGKPYSVELVSKSAEEDGVIHVVLNINRKTHVYKVETPRVKKAAVRMAKSANEVAAPTNGNIWRIGNPKRGAVRAGDIVRQGEEIANLEAMKMETPITAPFDGKVVEIAVKLNDMVVEGQLLFVLESVECQTPACETEIAAP